MNCDPFKLLFENLEVHKKSNSQNGSPLGSVWAHPFTLFHTFGSVNVTSRLHSWPVPLHALCSGCEFKARVMTPPISYNLFTFIPHILVVKC
jgi:hypothetical protein